MTDDLRKRYLDLWQVKPGFHRIRLDLFQPNPEKGGKLECPDHLRGEAYTPESRTPIEADVARHFDGDFCLAIWGAGFGCIDIDVPDYDSFDAEKWIADREAIIDESMLIASPSKSGGVRLWRFVSGRISPGLILNDLRYWSQRLGLDPLTVDLFPKGKSTCQIPFCDLRESFGADLQGFIELAEACRIGRDDLREFNAVATTDLAARTETTTSRPTGSGQAVESITELAPSVRTADSSIRYRLNMSNGDSVTIESVSRLLKWNYVRDQIAQQSGELIIDMTQARWLQNVKPLFDARDRDTDPDSVEDAVLYVVNNAVRTQLNRREYSLAPLNDSDRIDEKGLAVWVEESTRTVWFHGSKMRQEVVNTRLAGVIGPQRFADIIRAAGGTVPKSGKHVPGHGTERLSGLPIPDEMFKAMQAADFDPQKLELFSVDDLAAKFRPITTETSAGKHERDSERFAARLSDDSPF